MTEKIKKSEAEWRTLLSEEEYRICRQGGTERAFTGRYWQADGKAGRYLCRCCQAPLFQADSKYDSGSGWPSFYQAAQPDAIDERTDDSLAMRRTEILCARCDAHLGHVFNDGPAPTGLRYCVNSASLQFEPAQGTDNE